MSEMSEMHRPQSSSYDSGKNNPFPKNFYHLAYYKDFEQIKQCQFTQIPLKGRKRYNMGKQKNGIPNFVVAWVLLLLGAHVTVIIVPCKYLVKLARTQKLLLKHDRYHLFCLLMPCKYFPMRCYGSMHGAECREMN